MAEETRVKGLKELNAFLQQVPAKVERNVLRGGLRAGAKVVLPVAQANAPKDTGQLAAGLKISTSARGGQVTAKIKATGPHAFLAPWMEYGTGAHRIVPKDDGGFLLFADVFSKEVEHPGIRPRPFMVPALVSQATPATIAVARYMRDRLASKHGLDTADLEFEAE